ncbi:MAG TPA: plastocyanin/azurin family copper-binding protein [Acidimicrobiia bacterium]
MSEPDPKGVARRVVAAVSGALVVAALAGCGGGGGSDAKPYRQPTGPADSTLNIDASNFSFDPDHPVVKAGVVDLRLHGTEGTHTLVFDDNKEPGFQLEVNSGDTDAKKVDLKPGKYTFYCDIIGHRAQGMEGTITVK